MPQLDVLDVKNNKVGSVEFSASVFDAKINKHLVKQYVVLQQANRRLGTASTKSSYGRLVVVGKNLGVKRELGERGLEHRGLLFGVEV